MQYFGTNLDSPGHYFWTVGQYSLCDRNLDFDKVPFDPEELPKSGDKWNRTKGDTFFYFIDGYSIIAIEGSCIDKRWGTKSVFFLEGKVDPRNMWEVISQLNPVTKAIIDKMPFTINLKF